MYLMYTLDEQGNRLYSLKVGGLDLDTNRSISSQLFTESNRGRTDNKVGTSWYAVRRSRFEDIDINAIGGSSLFSRRQVLSPASNGQETVPCPANTASYEAAMNYDLRLGPYVRLITLAEMRILTEISFLSDLYLYLAALYQ